MKKFTFALATTIALGATAAHATTPSTVSAGTFAHNATSLTVPGTGTGKITFSTAVSLGFLSASTSFSGKSTGTVELGDAPVADGSLIGPATSFAGGVHTYDSTFASLFSGLSVNDNAVGNDIVLPFEFIKSGKEDYGWIELDVTKSALDTYSFKLDDYAYTTNGDAILAGTTSAVPEPASFVLMLAGGLGLVGWRRRQQVRG